MTIDYLSTEHFSDVEVSARSIAESVKSLRRDLALSKQLVADCWVGEGRVGFDDLYKVISWQLDDVSEEFWAMYELLIDAEVSYMEADQEVATKIASGEPFDLREGQRAGGGVR